MSYPHFSEVQFLSKDPQSPKALEGGSGESRMKSLNKASSEYSADALIEKQLLTSLSDCRQLDIPYALCFTRLSNHRFLTLADLKEMCSERQYLRGKENSTGYDRTAETDNIHIYDRSAHRTMRNQVGLPLTTAMDRSSEHTRNGNELLLDIFLETSKDLDKDEALEIFADLFNHDGSSTGEYDLQPADVRVLSCDAPTTCKNTNMAERTFVTNHNKNLLSALNESQPHPRLAPDQSLARLPVSTTNKCSENSGISGRPFWRCNKLYWKRWLSRKIVTCLSRFIM